MDLFISGLIQVTFDSETDWVSRIVFQAAVDLLVEMVDSCISRII